MSESIFNEGSIDVDFRVEGNGSTHAFFVEGETDRIGVGTNDPSAIVDVQGSAQIPGLYVYNNDSTNSYGIDIAAGNDANDYILRARDRAGTTKAIILGDGKVGIGTTSPTHKLTVEGDATDGGTGNDGQLALRGATNTNLRLMMGMDTSSEYGFISPMKLGTSWNNLSLCYNGGNVGIGDNAPATKLDVNGDIQIQGANAMILNHTTGAASDTYINSPSSDVMVFRTSGTERGRFDDQGNFGIGASGSNLNARIVRGFSANKGLVIETAQPAIQLVDTDNTSRYFTLAYEQGAKTVYMHNQSNGPIRFDTNEVPRMEITGAGYLKAGNVLHDDYSNYDASAVLAGTDHALVNRENSSYVLRCWQSHASNPYGIIVKYVNADVSNTSNHFFVGAEDNQDRFQLRSNGGLANFQSNNADLSDERAKKEIANISSQYNFIKSLKIRSFKYKEDTDEDRVKTGIIAQEVEALDASLIDNTGTYTSKHIKKGENAKLVYDKDIHYRTIKALQESIVKIEILESEVTALKGN